MTEYEKRRNRLNDWIKRADMLLNDMSIVIPRQKGMLCEVSYRDHR